MSHGHISSFYLNLGVPLNMSLVYDWKVVENNINPKEQLLVKSISIYIWFKENLKGDSNPNDKYISSERTL